MHYMIYFLHLKFHKICAISCIPLHTQCIQSIGALSGKATSFSKTLFPCSLKNHFSNLALTWLSYLPGCLQVPQPNFPLYWVVFSSIALAGKSGTTDWISITERAGQSLSSSNSHHFEHSLASLTKCFKNNFMPGLLFPYHTPVKIMLQYLYLSCGGSSTRNGIRGQTLNFLDLSTGAPSLLTTSENTFFPLFVCFFCKKLWKQYHLEYPLGFLRVGWTSVCMSQS